jgi:hypothetical protein
MRDMKRLPPGGKRFFGLVESGIWKSGTIRKNKNHHISNYMKMLDKMSIADESWNAANRSYFPHLKDVLNVLNLFNLQIRQIWPLIEREIFSGFKQIRENLLTLGVVLFQQVFFDACILTVVKLGRKAVTLYLEDFDQSGVHSATLPFLHA